MPEFSPNNFGQSRGHQMKIDFEAQEKLSTERAEIISMYPSLAGDSLKNLHKKEDGKWYVKDQTIEDWEADGKRLDEKDPDDYKYGRR